MKYNLLVKEDCFGKWEHVIGANVSKKWWEANKHKFVGYENYVWVNPNKAVVEWDNVTTCIEVTKRSTKCYATIYEGCKFYGPTLMFV